MKNLVIGLMSILLLSSCTTSYLTDDDNYLIGYEGREDGGAYKDGKRRDVTVKEPLIQNIVNEPAPDLVALPVEKVAVKNAPGAVTGNDDNLSGTELNETNKIDGNMQNQSSVSNDAKTITVDDAAKDKLSVDTSTVLTMSEVKVNEAINLPEENEKIEQNPPAAPEIKEKMAEPDNSVLSEHIDDATNILTLLHFLRFKNNSSHLSDADFKGIKNIVVDAQKLENKRIKIIVYAPLGYEKKLKKLYTLRRSNVVNAVNKYGVNKDMIDSDIEETNIREMFNRVEFYIAY